jgi:hypothetical protein
LDEEQYDVLKPNKVRTINDRAAAPLALNQSGARQYCQVRGHGVLRNCEQAGEFARRKAVRLAAHEEPKRLEPCVLSKGRKCGDSYGRIHRIHIARFIDMCNASRIMDACDGCATFTNPAAVIL